jgi:hypothetical protein
MTAADLGLFVRVEVGLVVPVGFVRDKAGSVGWAEFVRVEVALVEQELVFPQEPLS